MTWVGRVKRDHRPELEHALIAAGLRLRDAEAGRLPWRDVYIVARHAPTGSPLAVALNPEQATWGATENLLAILVDQFNGLMYGLGDGKGPKPDPIARPWGQPGREMKRFVGKVMSQAQVAERLNRRWARTPVGVAEGPTTI